MSSKDYCGCNKEKTKQNNRETASAFKKKKLVSKIAIVLMANLLLLGSCGSGKGGDKAKTSLDNISVGDVVAFGSYEQDNDTSNGAEAIEWEVLEVKDGKALILSKYGIDTKPYHEDKKSVTWEECTLRTWLNGDFYNTSFSDAERERVQLTTLTNDDNQYYEMDGGNDTEDKIFILSKEEVLNYYDSDKINDLSNDWYVVTNGDAQTKATEYAKYNGAWVNSSTKGSYYWLRSIGSRRNCAGVVSTSGYLNIDGFYVNNAVSTVRPAMWINIEG